MIEIIKDPNDEDKILFCPICEQQLVRSDIASWQYECPTKVTVFVRSDISDRYDKKNSHYMIDPKEPYEKYIIEGYPYTNVHEIIILMPYRISNNFGSNTSCIEKWVDPTDSNAGFSYVIGARHFEKIIESLPLLRYSKGLEARIKNLLVFL